MSDLLQQLKNVYHYFQAQFWRARYGWPDRQLHIYGITGTNGKTTTAIVLASILRQAHGSPAIGLLSTEYFWIGESEETNNTHMTSTDARVVFAKLRQMADRKVTHVVLELTSHALDQHRLAGVVLEGAIITNITHEHLDYHHTMERLATAKARIANYLKTGSTLVVNKHDLWSQRATSEIRRQHRGLPISEFSSEAAKKIETPLTGEFNKENVLAARMLAEAIGVEQKDIAAGISSVDQIPGRVDWLTHPSGVRVVVDFALTADALERLYKALRPETSGRLVAVFGAAGQRDRAKRPILTKIAASHVDELILTQDEPYSDSEAEIYAELEAGLVDATIPWQRIEDRREAISYALDHASAGDVIAVTGMGNYNSRMVGRKAIPWNDKQVVQELLDALK